MSAALKIWPPWPPPNKKQRPERGEHRVGPEPVASRRTWKQNHITRERGNGQTDRPFRVLITVFGRAEPWDRYRTAGEATTEIAKLRRDGYQAELVLP